MNLTILKSKERLMKNASRFRRFIKFMNEASLSKICLLILLFMDASSVAISQNLLVNPGAELSPAGTGWTVISSGANVCVAGSAASTYSNWTMTPDGSPNYPAAHTGTKTFYAGCNTIVPGGPFELSQTVDVTSDASQIDAGLVSFTFSGFIQTPISAQADAGRFIVDYLDASDNVLGTSYTSGYQSGTGGSGSSWIQYINTRQAATGTRKIRVRLQTTIATGPAINAYFDDISLTSLVTLPIVLVSFTGKQNNDNIELNWSVNDAQDFSGFEIEKSTDAINFVTQGAVDYVKGKADYYYTEKNTPGFTSVFYRLKMSDVTGLFSYSPTLVFNSNLSVRFAISPNPATNNIVVTGLNRDGTVFIRNTNGNVVEQFHTLGRRTMLDISALKKGIYFVSYYDGISLNTQKLIVQ